MGKKPNLSIVLIAMVLLMAVVIGGVGYLALRPTTGGITTPSSGGITPPSGNGACPSTLGTNFQGDYINSLDLSAASYGGMPFRLVPDGNFAQYTAYTCAALATRTSASVLKCDHDYQIITVPVVDTFNPLPPISLGRVSGYAIERAVQGANFSLLQVNAYDNINRGLVWDDSQGAAAGTYNAVAVTLESTTSNVTAYAIGVGGTLDWDIGVKTVTNMEQFGNSNLGVYIAVDADKTDYDAPLLQLDGVTLVDVKNSGELSADDLATLSSFEYIFKVPAGIQLQNSPKTLRLYVAGKSGVNPDATPVLRFLAKSNYVGMDGYTIYTDVFNRASASETISATASTVTISVT